MRSPSRASVPAARAHRPSQAAHMIGPASERAACSSRISAGFIGTKRRAASVFWLTSSVFIVATHAEVIRSSDQIACNIP